MTKQELIDHIYSNESLSLSKRESEVVIEAVFESLREAIVKDERFAYPGFGTFQVKSRRARIGRNPRTGEEIQIPASKTVSFKPAPKLKDSL